jgi:hypothetical protein
VIGYLATAEHSYTMKCYLRTWGLALARRIKVLAYETLPALPEVNATTWIFSDLERLSITATEAATDLWERLSDDRRVRPLNNPRRVLGRYELLRRLHERGMNDFRVYRLSQLPQNLRFPVFVRDERDHAGVLSHLVPTAESLEESVAALTRAHQEDRLLIVEFCDTSDDAGIFRRYSAFSVGGQIVPREVNFSRNWMLRDIDLLERDMLAEERAYVEQNPHASELGEIFRLANVEYGRVDYALLDGKPQVWEINTNPMVMLLPWCYQPRHLPQQWRFSKKIRSAFDALDRAPIHGRRRAAIQP